MKSNLRLLTKRLEAEYYSVTALDNGLDAIAYCQEYPVDVLLLDVVMPGLDGFETCRALKSEPATKDIPIILLTSLNTQKDRLKGFELGADDFISKPVNDVALVSRIKIFAQQKLMLEDLRAHSTKAFQDDLAIDLDQELSIDDGRNGKILVLDDNAEVAQKLAAQLSDEQEVEILATSVALSSLKSAADWNAIVLNFNQQEIDPLIFISRLKAQRDLRHVPVLAIVEPSQEKKLQKGFELGVTNYLFSPFQQDELKARVRREVSQNRMLRELHDDVENTMELAVTDPLTGLQNRRFLERQLATLIDQSLRYERDLSLMMMDIDKFKVINDEYGHAVGDVVLKEVAHRLRKSLRGSDLACRFGGEEFVCVLAETGLDVAMKAAERLRAGIESMPFIINDEGQSIQVTASFGVTQFLGKGDGIDDFIKRADQALYKAKFSGRNLVVSNAA
ncbi:MAG: PleD family two-component system response regulator [Rhizobiales bacterium]|nr:PleD family two-component system response regulator [Hyphomicrobiales bacterium]